MGGDKFKARPTTYKGIRMRSRLEAGYAMWLDTIHAQWEYEPECYATEAGQYLPDFRIDNIRDTLGPERFPVFVEVKPAGWGGDLDLLARRMSIIPDATADELGDCAVILEQPGVWPREPTLYEDGTAGWLPRPWVPLYDASIKCAEYALAAPLYPENLPWPDRYWEVRGGS